VVARAQRRRFSAEYKMRILQEADRCAPGELGALLQREGLYSSNLSRWRGPQAGQLAGRRPKKRGPRVDARAKELARLEGGKARLQAQLEWAELTIEAQKKLLVLLNQEIPEGPEPT
jgi:transposase